MAQATDDLLQSIQQLEQWLAKPPAGRERNWAARVDQALAAAEETLQLENTDLRSDTDGPFKAVDMTRPSLVRCVGELRRQLAADVGATAALRSEVQAAGRGAAPDFGALRHHLEEFVRDLRQLREGEIDVVQESVTTDLGAGD
jgi:hypothetical protein